MGNSSKKHAKKDGTKEGGRADDQTEPGGPSVTKAESQLEADRSDISEARGTDKPKLNKDKNKEKKKKDKKKGKEKGKKNEKNKLKTKEDLKAPVISNGTNCIDVTNFQGDAQSLSEAVTISVCVEPKPSDNMGGKENTRPLTVYEGRSRPRPVSPTGPGVSKLMEKFGGKSGGTPRPISFPAAKTPNDSPRSDLHQAVTRKPFGFNRLEETPQRRGGDKGLADGNVNALRLKFGAQNSAASTPTTKPTTPASTSSSKHTSTPTTTAKSGGGWGNRLQNERTPGKSKSSLKKDADRSSSSSTTTPTSTSGVSAVRSKFNKNREDGTRGSDTEQLLSNPENKRKIEEKKRAEEAVQKENAKNRSPRKHWSPKKEPRPPSREETPTKETSPRKRKSGMLQKFGKTKQATKDEREDDVLRRDEEEKEKARQLILNRTSALIHGTNNTPKATAPSKVQFEESTPKRTRREEKPKQRPKTEYNFQSVPSPRPKSMADNIQVSTPPSFDKTISGGTNIIKNPTTKTQKLLQWCQIHTQGYKGVKVSNFSSSWADGLAFCALVHKFFPTAFNFNALSSSNRRDNFDLAFSSAEKHAKVPQLLETEDMIIMGNKPDWKCVFTYVTSLYAGLTKHSNLKG